MTTEEQNSQFGQWLEAHAAILHHVAHGFAEGADRHDLMQELLLAVWRAIPAFRRGSRPSTFIYRVAHNTALTWRRSQRTYQGRIDALQTLAPSEGPDGRAADAREREALEHVYHAIRTLPPLDRSIVLLHLDGVSYADIAQIHGLTENNVGVRLSRLKQKLAQALEGVAHELR